MRAKNCALVAAVLLLAVGMTAAQSTYNQAAQVTQGPTIQYADDRFAVITWTTAAASDSRIFYGTDQNNLNLFAEGQMSTPTHRVDLRNLQANTTYYFQIDLGQSDTSAASAPTLSFRTPAEGGTPLREQAATQVSGGMASSGMQNVSITRGPTIQYVDDGSAVITWSTSAAAPGVVYYGTDANNLRQTAEDDAQGSAHRVHLWNLNPATTYYFQVELGGGPSRSMRFQTVASGARPVYDQPASQYGGASSSGQTGGLAQRPAASQARPDDVPAGTVIEATLQTALSSKTSQAGQKFTAVVAQPVPAANGAVAIAAGSRINGEVTEAEEGKTLPSIRGRGKLNLHFSEMVLPNGTAVPITATLMSVHTTKGGAKTSEEGEVQGSTKGSTAAKSVGIGAGLGTLAGLIFGGPLKGLVIGAVAGGGYVLATGGKDVELPADTGMKLRLDQNVRLGMQGGTGR